MQESSGRQSALPEPVDLATIAGGAQIAASAGVSLPMPVNLSEIGSTAFQQMGAGLPSPAPIETFASATGAAALPTPEPLEALGVKAFGEPPVPLPIEQVLAATEPGLQPESQRRLPEPAELDELKSTDPSEKEIKHKRKS
jgi:hypothetical protein